MWLRVSLVCCTIVGTTIVTEAPAQNPASGGGWRTGGGSRAYPEVYGPTGRRYGPTQAAYQYQLQYGRTWRNGEGLRYVNGYPGGGGGGFGGGWGGFPIVAPIFDAPIVNAPPVIGIPSTAFYGSTFVPPQPILPNGVMNPVFPVNPQLQPIPSEAQFNSGLPAANGNFKALANAAPIIEPSTPAAQQQSIQLQAQGDIQLQQLNYYGASERYRRAIDAARDRIDPRYRLAVTLIGRGRFLEAIDQLKLCVAIDPHWPAQAESLESLIGHHNALEKVRIQSRVVEWVREDVRDPNRLFLMAVVMFLDGDDRAKTVLESAITMAGPEPHLVAFLNAPVHPADIAPPVQQPAAQPPAANQPAANQPPANVPPPPQPGLVLPQAQPSQPPQQQAPATTPPPVQPESSKPASPPLEIPPPSEDKFVPPLPDPKNQAGPILPPRA